MSELGERLRATRESQGISIAQAAVETRILQRYLVALEDGDFQHLPGDVYARGFIRNYAMYLGIPSEELIELYRRERGTTEPIQVVPATSSPRIRGFVVPSFFGVFFVVLALVGMSYLVLNATNFIGENSNLTTVAIQPTTAPIPSPLPTTAPAPTGETIVAVVPTVAPTPPSPSAGGVVPTPEPTATPEAPIVFEVHIDQGDNPGSWLEIKTDGTSVFRQVLGPGETLRYAAQREISVRAGNAAVVSLIVNGQAMPRLSTTPGEVQTFVWPPR